MKILIIQQKMIGDVLTSGILFEALKVKYPDSELHYVINSHTYPVVENNPFIDKFKFFTPQMEENKTDLYRFIRDIKRENYDVIIDVYGKLSSTLISFASSARIKIARYKKHTSFLYTHTPKKIKSPIHNSSLAIENRMLLLEPLDVDFSPYTPKIFLTETEISTAKHFLEQSGINLSQPLVMVSVLGSADNKTYPKEYMAKALDLIVKEQPQVQLLFNYVPKQKEEAKSIFKLCTQDTQKRIFFDVYGKSLREFCAITAHCNASLGNEGGAINIAKALNKPTFTIFAPYLTKHNWFGAHENPKHTAIHLMDYLDYHKKEAKKQPELFYLKLKPELITPKLNAFLKSFN